MEDAIATVCYLFPPCLKCEFSYLQQSHLITKVTFLSDSSLFRIQRTSSSRMGNYCRHRKFQILVAIHASLPAIAKKATLLQDAGVPDPPAAAIITVAATSSSEKLGTSTRR